MKELVEKNKFIIGSFLFTIILQFCIILSSTAFAFDNEPDGFRGLKWGTTIEEFKQAYPDAKLRTKQAALEYNPAKLVRYLVSANGGNLSGIPINNSLEYSFYNNQLESVLITLAGKDNYETLKNQKLLLERMSMMYGEVNERDGNNIDDFIPAVFSATYNFDYVWKGETTTINLNGYYKEPNLISGLSVSVVSTQIRKQWITSSNPLDKEEWSKMRKNLIAEYRSGW